MRIKKKQLCPLANSLSLPRVEIAMRLSEHQSVENSKSPRSISNDYESESQNLKVTSSPKKSYFAPENNVRGHNKFFLTKIWA